MNYKINCYKRIITSILLASSFLTFAQVQIDKDIQLNGTTGNRDINGVETIDVSVGYKFNNSVGTAGQVLRSDATNGFVGAPLISGDIPNLDAAKITTGTLGVANGGTGIGTAFTAGSVVFAGASGVYTQNNASFFWDSTNARLGIGTNTPDRLLTVVSTSEWNIASRSTNNTSTNRNHILIQRANGNAAVTANFNLGGIAMSGFDGVNYGLGWNGGAEITAFANQTWTSTNRGTYLTFATTADNTTSITERMRVNNAGNVGIGTTDPLNHRLMITKAGSANGAALRVEQTGDNSWGHVGILRTSSGNDGAKLLFQSRNVKTWSTGGQASSDNFEISEDGGDGIIGTGFGTQRMRIEPGGAIFGKFRQVLYQNFNNPTYRNTNGVVWFPIGFEGNDRDIASVTAGPNHDPTVEFVAPYSGRIVQVRFQVDGSSSGGQEARGRIVSSINGTVNYYTAAGTMMDLNETQGATIGFPLNTSGFSFAQGDRVAIGFIYGEANNAGCPSGDCFFEDNDYGVVTIIEYNVQY